MTKITINTFYEFADPASELYTGFVPQGSNTPILAKIKKSMDFMLPVAEYDVGPEILVLKGLLNAALASGAIPVDEYLQKSKCESFPEVSDGPLFDFKTKVALTLWQRANMHHIVAYHHSTYGGDRAARERDALSALGLFDEATFAVMHGFVAAPDRKFYNNAYYLPRDIPTRADSSGRTLADEGRIPSSPVHSMVYELLLDTVSAKDAKDARIVAQFGKILHDVSAEMQEEEKNKRSIEVFTRPDPETARDPYVVSNSIIGLMLETRFTLDNPPDNFETEDGIVNLEDYERSMTAVALNIVFDYYNKAENYNIKIRNYTPSDNRGNLLPPLPVTYTSESETHSYIANVEGDVSQTYPQVSSRVADLINANGLGGVMEDEAEVKSILFSLKESTQIRQRAAASANRLLRGTVLEGVFKNNILGPLHPTDKFVDDHDIPIIQLVGYETPSFRTGQKYKAEFRISRRKLDLVPTRRPTEALEVAQLAQDFDLPVDQSPDLETIVGAVTSPGSDVLISECDAVEKSTVYASDVAIDAALKRNEEKLEELREKARQHRMRIEAEYRRAMEMFKKDEERVERRRALLSGNDSGTLGDYLGQALQGTGAGEAVGDIAGSIASMFDKTVDSGNPLRITLDDLKSEVKKVAKALKDLKEDYEEWKSEGYDEETGTGGEIKSVVGLDPVNLDDEAKRLEDMVKVIEKVIDAGTALHKKALKQKAAAAGQRAGNYSSDSNPLLEIKFKRVNSNPIPQLDGTSKPGFDLGFQVESIRGIIIEDQPKLNVWPYLLESGSGTGTYDQTIVEALDLLDSPTYASGYMLQLGAILDFLKTPIKALQGSCLDFLRAAPSIALITRFTVPTQIITQPADEEGLSRLSGPLKEEAEKLQDQWDAYVISVEKGLAQWTSKGEAFAVADLLPAFGPGCGKTWEEAMNTMYKEFLDKFNIGVLICELLKCLGLWPIGLNLDLKLTIPKFPKLPIFDYLGPLKKLTLDVLKQMLIRLFCQICRKIIELLKLEACTPESAAMPQRPGSEFPSDLSDYLPVAAAALTDTGVPPELLDDVSDVVDDMAMIMSPVEMCGLMRGDPTERSLIVIKNMIASSAPELSEHLNTTHKIKVLFAKIGFMMGTSICDSLEEAVRENPIDCRCPEAVELSDRLSENLVTKAQKDAALDIARKNVEDMLNAFQKLAKGDIASDMIGDLVNFGNPDSPLSSMPEGMKELLHMGTKALLEPTKSEFYSDVATYVPAFYEQMTVVETKHSTDGGVDIIAERERIEALERLRLYDYHLALIDEEHPYGLPYLNSGWYKGGWTAEYWKRHGAPGKKLGGRNLDALMNSGGGWNVVYRIMWLLREILYAPFQEEWYDQETGAVIDIFYDNRVTKKMFGYEASKKYLGMPVVLQGHDYFSLAGRKKIAEGQENKSIKPWYMQPGGSWHIFDVQTYADNWSSLMNSGRWIKRLKMTRSPVYAPWGDVGLALVQPNGWIDADGNFSPGFFKANGIVSSTQSDPDWSKQSIAAATAFYDPNTGVSVLDAADQGAHLARAIVGINFDNYNNQPDDHWSRTCIEKPVMMFKEYPDHEITSQIGQWSAVNYDPNSGVVQSAPPWARSYFAAHFQRMDRDNKIRKIEDRLKTTWAPAISITNLKGSALLLESEYKVATLGRGGKCCYAYPGIPGWKEGRPSWYMMVDEMVKSISEKIRELMKVVNDSIRTTTQSAQSSMGRRKYVFLPTLKDFFSKEAEVIHNKFRYVGDQRPGLSNKTFLMTLPPRLLGLDNKQFKKFEGILQYEEHLTTGMYDPYNIVISDPFFLNDISPIENTVVISRCDEFPETIGNCDEDDPNNPCIRLSNYISRFNEPYDSRMQLFTGYVGEKFRNVIDAYESSLGLTYEAQGAPVPESIQEAFRELKSRFLGFQFKWSDFYKKGFENIVEDVFDQIADSPFFTEPYIADLGNRISGKTYMDNDGCIVNSDSDPNKGIVDFEKVLRNAMDSVMSEYSKPEAFKNIDYTKPGPFEKAVRKISTELLVRVFMIEFSLRGGIAFSTFNAQRIFSQEGLVKEFIENWIRDHEFSEKRNPILYNIKEDFQSAIKELAGLNTYEEALSKVLSRQLDPTWSGNFVKFADKLFQPKIVDSPQYAFMNRIPRGNPWKAESLAPISKQSAAVEDSFAARRIIEDEEQEFNAFFIGEKSISFPKPAYDFYGETSIRPYDLYKDGVFFLEFYVRLEGEANRRMLMSMQSYSDLLEQRYDILMAEDFSRPNRGIVSSVYHIDEFTQFASGRLIEMFELEGFSGIGYYPPSEDALSLRPVSAERYPTRAIKLDRFHSTISWKDCPALWLNPQGNMATGLADPRTPGSAWNAIPDSFDWLGTPWEDYPFANGPNNHWVTGVKKRKNGWDETRYFVAPADIREAFRSLSEGNIIDEISENYGRRANLNPYMNAAMSQRPVHAGVRHRLSTRHGGVYANYVQAGFTNQERWENVWATVPVIHNTTFIAGGTINAPIDQLGTLGYQSERLFKVTAIQPSDGSETIVENIEEIESMFNGGHNSNHKAVVRRGIEMAGSRVSTLGIEGKAFDTTGRTITGNSIEVYPLYDEIFSINFSEESNVDIASGEMTAGAYMGYGEVTKAHWDTLVDADVFNPVSPPANQLEHVDALAAADAEFNQVYEHWTQYVIDIVGLAAPSYVNPGESYHSVDDLPALSWDDLEQISRADSEQLIVSWLEADQASREIAFRTAVSEFGDDIDSNILFPDRYFQNQDQDVLRGKNYHYSNILSKAPRWTWNSGEVSHGLQETGRWPTYAGSRNYSTWLFGPARGLRALSGENWHDHAPSVIDAGTPAWSPTDKNTFFRLRDSDALFRSTDSPFANALNSLGLAGLRGLQVLGGSMDPVNHHHRLRHHQPYLYTWVPAVRFDGSPPATLTHQNNFKARLSRPLGKIALNSGPNYGAAGMREPARTAQGPMLTLKRNLVSHEHNWWELNGYDVDRIPYADPMLLGREAGRSCSWVALEEGQFIADMKGGELYTTEYTTQTLWAYEMHTGDGGYAIAGAGGAAANRRTRYDGAGGDLQNANIQQRREMMGTKYAYATNTTTDTELAEWTATPSKITKRTLFDYRTQEQIAAWTNQNPGKYHTSRYFQSVTQNAANAPGSKGMNYASPLRHDADSYRCPLRLLVTKVEYIVNGDVVDMETYIDYDIPKTLEGADFQMTDLSVNTREIIGYDEVYTGESQQTSVADDPNATNEDRIENLEQEVFGDEEISMQAAQSENAYDPHDPSVNYLRRTPIFSEQAEEQVFNYPKSKTNLVRRECLQLAADRAVENYRTYQENTSEALKRKFTLQAGNVTGTKYFDWGFMDSGHIGDGHLQGYDFGAAYYGRGNSLWNSTYSTLNDLNRDGIDDTGTFRSNSRFEVVQDPINAGNVTARPSQHQLTRLSFASRADTIFHGFLGARTDDVRYDGADYVIRNHDLSVNDAQVNSHEIINIPFTTVASIYSDAANIEVMTDYESNYDGRGRTRKQKNSGHVRDLANSKRVLGLEPAAQVPAHTKITANYFPDSRDKLPRRFARDQVHIDAQFARRPGMLIKDFSWAAAPGDDALTFAPYGNPDGTLNEVEDHKKWYEAMDVPSYFPSVSTQRFMTDQDRAYDASAFPSVRDITPGDRTRPLGNRDWETKRKKMRSFIDFYISTWISQRRFEGFWGRTSSKAWLRGVIPAENYSHAVPYSPNHEQHVQNCKNNNNSIICDSEWSASKLNNNRSSVLPDQVKASDGEYAHKDLLGLFPPQLPWESPIHGPCSSPMGPHAAHSRVTTDDEGRWLAPQSPSRRSTRDEKDTNPLQWYPPFASTPVRTGEEAAPGETFYSPMVADGRHNIFSTFPEHPRFMMPMAAAGSSPWASVEHNLIAMSIKLPPMHPYALRKNPTDFNVSSMIIKESVPSYFIGDYYNIDRYNAANAIKAATRYSRERGPLSDDFIRELSGLGQSGEAMDFRQLMDSSTVKFGIRLVQAASRNVTYNGLPFDLSTNASRELNSRDGQVEELFEEVLLGERTYYLNLGLDDSEPKPTICVPLISHEKEVPASCLVNPNSVKDLFSQHKALLLDRMVNSSEFDLITKYVYPTERVLAMASIYSTMALSTKPKLQGLLDPTKNALANLISLSGNKTIEYGAPWAKGTAFAGDNSNVDLAKQMGNMITSEGPKAGCGEMPNFDWKKFLKKLLEYILYLVPSILRAIAMMIDPAYKDMHRLFHQCSPKKEHVNSLTWGGVFPFTEYGWGLGVRGVEGKEIHNGVVRGNKYSPVFPAFPIDLFNGLTFIPVPPFVVPNPSFFKSLGKFASFIMGAMPFGIGGGAGVQLPACMGENMEGSDEAQKKLLDPATKYGNLLTPFGMLALSMPELPNERKRDMDKMCAEPWKRPQVAPVNMNFQRTIRDNTACKDGEKQGDQASNLPGSPMAGSNTQGNADNLFED